MNKKKSICFLGVNMNIARGGQRVAINLANELCERYHVHIIGLDEKVDDGFFALNSKIHYHAVSTQGQRIRKTFLKSFFALRKYLKKNNISVVFSVGASACLYVLMLTAFSRRKSVYCEHSNLNNALFADRGQRINQSLGAYFADRIVPLTNRDKKTFCERFKISEKKIIPIYNWVEDTLMNSENQYDCKAKKIITVGRIEPVKGYDRLIKVGKIVFDKHPDWLWEIYGDGELDEVEMMKQSIKKEHLEDNIILKGQVKNIYERYRDYALYVMTSRYEGLPMVLLEAKANRLPIISFDCETGPSEIVQNQKDGYLIENGNVEDMAEKIIYLMEHPEVRKDFSQHSWENLDKFNKKKILKQWIELIEHM